MCMCVRSLRHAPRCERLDCSPLGSSVHGLLQARRLEWVATCSSEPASPALHAGSLPLVAQLVKETACNAEDLGSIPGLGRSPGERKVIQSSILAWRIPWTSPWGCKESDTTEQLSLSLPLASAETPALSIGMVPVKSGRRLLSAAARWHPGSPGRHLWTETRAGRGRSQAERARPGIHSTPRPG